MLGDGIKTCWVCGGPLDKEGRCINVGDFSHEDFASAYCPQCPNKLPCAEHGETEHVL
jgi:hypothetical protein